MVIAPAGGRALEDLRFANAFAALGERFGERRAPAGIPGARLVAVSPDAAALIGLRPGEERRPEFLALVSGNALLPGMEPFAALYGGHQFGVWAGQLGDGRALLLGETDGWELQLKGSGKTAYSRFGDGRAVERSTIREFLCSEAMHHLGVPTTRALAMAAGTEPVVRERVEKSATVLRMAPSFVRFGNFEIFAARREDDAVRALADYVIARYYPGCDYGGFFATVVERTATLMAHWQAVGFSHGVMNTDNFSILGLTLDYGPFGFVEAYDPGFICNHTDETGRYALGRQPTIGLWNCYALADALASLIPAADREAALGRYATVYRDALLALLRAKLGLTQERDGDGALAAEALRLLEARRVDWTGFWRALSHDDGAALAMLGDDAAARDWLAALAARAASDGRPDGERRAAMRRTNPAFVLRNWVAQEAIAASEAGDDAPVRALLEVLRAPYDEHPAHAAWAAPAPARYADLQVSCSS